MALLGLLCVSDVLGSQMKAESVANQQNILEDSMLLQTQSSIKNRLNQQINARSLNGVSYKEA